MINALSRRSFLGAAGASAAVFSPRGVKGLTGPEIEARAGGGEVAEFGISMWDLDTPALLVDL
ncbi:MAG: twin-arginine translocation signal domain-containing protein, partial [Acidobacteriota bacterium]|nr:twin-arginine translocation signal domain-containing protein [Acidobacteriota bacterium]